MDNGGIPFPVIFKVRGILPKQKVPNPWNLQFQGTSAPAPWPGSSSQRAPRAEDIGGHLPPLQASRKLPGWHHPKRMERMLGSCQSQPHTVAWKPLKTTLKIQISMKSSTKGEISPSCALNPPFPRANGAVTAVFLLPKNPAELCRSPLGWRLQDFHKFRQ